MRADVKPRGNGRYWPIWLATGVLILAAALRLSRAEDLAMWQDEIWAMWYTFGSVGQTIAWTPPEWPPLYFVILRIWTGLVSHNDVTARFLSGLMGILGVAFIYRAALSRFSRSAGVMAALALAVSPYAIYFSTEPRGYALLFMLGGAIAWLHFRWLDRPTLKRSIPYWLAQTAFIYTSYTAGLALPFLGLHVLVSAPKRLLKWLAVEIAVGIAFLPWLPRFTSILTRRSANLGIAANSSWEMTLPQFFERLTGHQEMLYGLLASASIVGLVSLARERNARTYASLPALWGVGAIALVYLAGPRLNLFNTRYIIFAIPALVLLFGIGLGGLPKRWQYIAGAVLALTAVLPFHPFDFRPRYSDFKPIRDLVRAMGEMFEPGDVLVVDPLCGCGTPKEWWYFEHIYFPGGEIPRAEDGHEAGRRVWYLVDQRRIDPDVEASVTEGRIPMRYWGPWYSIVTLYAAPPLSPGIRFGDSIRFMGHEMLSPTVLHPGDEVRVRLWWSADDPPEREYSVGLYIFAARDGRLLAQNDGPPRVMSGIGLSGQEEAGPEHMTLWEPGAIYYEERTVQLPWQIGNAELELRLAVYRWEDGSRLEPEPGEWAMPDDSVMLERLWVEAY